MRCAPIFLRAVVLVAGWTLAAAALAHHGWSEYDSDKPLTLTGTIKESGYEHPHGHIQLVTAGKTWVAVLAPPSRMEARGLSATALKAGTTATVAGYPNRNKPEEMRAERITIDGKTVELRVTGPGDALGLIETLPLAVAMRKSLWLYPIVEIAHILGFVTLVGSVAMLDLRLLGFSRSVSVTALSRHTLPWSLGALVLVVPSGLMMFTAHAGDFISNPAFITKMTLLMAAGGNALWFRVGPYQGVAAWDTGVQAPLAARLSAGLSLLLWVSVISCGRLLAYV